jgi:hypothetical protein
MKKLRLDVDELRVDSFSASPTQLRAGVNAHDSATIYPTCRLDICSGESMCAGWCSNYDGCSNGGTCAVSCHSDPCVCVPQG